LLISLQQQHRHHHVAVGGVGHCWPLDWSSHFKSNLHEDHQ